MTEGNLTEEDAARACELIEELRGIFGYPSRFSAQYTESSDSSATIHVDFPRGRITAGTNGERESYTLQQSGYADGVSVSRSIPKSAQMSVPEDKLQE
jgi:hypothetical protein